MRTFNRIARIAFEQVRKTSPRQHVFTTFCGPSLSVLQSESLSEASYLHRMTIRHFSDGASDLSDLLARELLEEEAGNLDIPEELEQLRQQLSQDWTIVDDDTSGAVRMFSKPGAGPKVAIAFHCQDSLEGEYDDFEPGEEPSPAIRFTLTVTKAGKTMVMNCLSEEASAVVESVAVTMADVETVHANGRIDETLYQGPEFAELAEDVQDAFHTYVQTDCGIDTDVAAFISMYADYKEQSEYVRWLKQIQSII